MENNSPNFFGLGHQLSQVLNAMDIHHLKPVWTLKETRGKIFLDIVWTKLPFKSRATDDVNKGTRTVQSPIHDEPADEVVWDGKENKPTTPSPTVPVNCGVKTVGAGKKKKRKSPSVLKRDRARQRKWRECKQQKLVSSCQPDKQQDNKKAIVTPPLADNGLPTDKENQEYLDYLELEISKPVEKQEHKPKPEQEIKIPVMDETPTSEQNSDSDSDSLFEEMYKRIEEEVEEEYNEMEHLRRCFNLRCLTPETHVPGGLRRCTRCKIAVYCNLECQTEHWKIHRSVCGKNM